MLACDRRRTLRIRAAPPTAGSALRWRTENFASRSLAICHLYCAVKQDQHCVSRSQHERQVVGSSAGAVLLQVHSQAVRLHMPCESLSVGRAVVKHDSLVHPASAQRQQFEGVPRLLQIYQQLSTMSRIRVKHERHETYSTFISQSSSTIEQERGKGRLLWDHAGCCEPISPI